MIEAWLLMAPNDAPPVNRVSGRRSRFSKGIPWISLDQPCAIIGRIQAARSLADLIHEEGMNERQIAFRCNRFHFVACAGWGGWTNGLQCVSCPPVDFGCNGVGVIGVRWFKPTLLLKSVNV